MPVPVAISAAVEGLVDEAVVRKVIACAEGQAGPVYSKNGKDALRRQINGFNNAAKHQPWFVLVDLNGDAACAPLLRQNWLPAPAPLMCFRIAVRQVEAWLMADADTLAGFLRVSRSKVPRNPEALPNAKSALIDLVRHSPKRAIREDMLPRQGSGRSVGPAYASRLIEYVEAGWRPQEAAQRSDSLRRAIHRLQRLVKGVP